jgi:hypothetical protein
VVLMNGALPLVAVRQQVMKYIAEKQAGSANVQTG